MSLLKQIGRTVFICGALLIILSGIGRDDVPLKKYYEFAKDSTFNCVGEVYSSKGKFIQSFVLINKNYLLATAHGFYNESKELVNDSITVLNVKYPIKRPATSSLADKSSFYFKINNKVYFAEKIIIHPNYVDGFNSNGYYDIALIKLNVAITAVSPAILYTDSTEKGARGIVCGYGATIKTSSKSILPFVRRKKMAGENMIDSLGGNLIKNSFGLLFADMDHPRISSCNRMGDAKPLPLEMHGDAGDCGGGLFLKQGNEWRLAGISFAPSYYDDWKLYGQKYGYYGFVDGWTRIAPLVDWIENSVDNE